MINHPNRFKIDPMAPLAPYYIEEGLEDLKYQIRPSMTNSDLWQWAYGVAANQFRHDIVGPEYSAKIAARQPGLAAWAVRIRSEKRKSGRK